MAIEAGAKSGIICSCAFFLKISRGSSNEEANGAFKGAEPKKFHVTPTRDGKAIFPRKIYTTWDYSPQRLILPKVYLGINPHLLCNRFQQLGNTSLLGRKGGLVKPWIELTSKGLGPQELNGLRDRFGTPKLGGRGKFWREIFTRGIWLSWQELTLNQGEQQHRGGATHD